MEDPAQWVVHTQRFELGEDIPEDMVPSTQFIYVRESDQKILGNDPDSSHIHSISGKLTADISAIPSAQVNGRKDMQQRCSMTVSILPQSRP